MNKTFNANGRVINLDRPTVMGILNLTPDSFYDGNKHNSIEAALTHVRKLVAEGIDILDVGAASSRPGASKLSADQELTRLEPVLTEIVTEFPTLSISIDTYWRKVAERSVKLGASMINDISAGSIDSELIDFVAESKLPYILMHMQGDPSRMQKDPKYVDIVADILKFFIDKFRILEGKGITDVIIDPGFGFGKTLDHNYQLLNKLSIFHLLDAPILVGISRKSMIYKLLGITPEESLSATTAIHLQALLNGAHILRVHDVIEAKQAIALHQQISRIQSV